MERRISSELIYRGRIIDVYNDTVTVEGGKKTYREVVSHRGSVAMLPIEDNHVYLVKQYRYAVNDYLLEIPAGTLEDGEEPEACARRELMEEINMESCIMEKMTTLYPSPGYINEIMHLYLCKGLKPAEGIPDEDEHIEIVKMDIKSLREMIVSDRLRDGKTVTALLMYFSLYS